jgi:hypothetical protein
VRGGDPARIPAWSRAGLWLATAFATALALARPSVVSLWHDLGSIVTPTLLLPVLLAFARRGRPGPRAVLWLMLVPCAVTLGWVLGKASAGRYPLDLEPIYAGLGASLLVWAVTAIPRKEPAA